MKKYNSPKNAKLNPNT